MNLLSISYQLLVQDNNGKKYSLDPSSVVQTDSDLGTCYVGQVYFVIDTLQLKVVTTVSKFGRKISSTTITTMNEVSNFVSKNNTYILDKVEQTYAKKDEIVVTDNFATLEYVNNVTLNLATTSYVDTASANVVKLIPSTSNLATTTYVNNVSLNIMNSIPSTANMATTSYVDTASANVVKLIPSTENLASKTYVDTASANVVKLIPSTSNLATTTYVNNVSLNIMNSIPSTDDFVTKTSFAASTQNLSTKTYAESCANTASANVAKMIPSTDDFVTKTSFSAATQNLSTKTYAENCANTASANVAKMIPSTSNLATTTYVDNKFNLVSQNISLNGVFLFNGNVPTYSDLPIIPTDGWVCTVEDTKMKYVWDETNSQWYPLTMDYVTMNETTYNELVSKDNNRLYIII